MSSNNENVDNDSAMSAQVKLFAKNFVHFILHLDPSFNGELHRAEQCEGFLKEIFNDQIKMAVIYFDGVYRKQAKNAFEGIVKENIGNILWFTEHVLYERAEFFNKDVDYGVCLQFSVYLAILATYLYHHGIKGILNIAEELIAVLFSSIFHTGEMEKLNNIAQKYAKCFNNREVTIFRIHQIAYEVDEASLKLTIDDYIDRYSTILRMENGIVEEHQHSHVNDNEVMDEEENKENLKPIQSFSFCGKSQTSSLEPTARQMQNKHSNLDFTAIRGTSLDTSTVADYPCLQSQSISATNMVFKRRLSNESSESENIAKNLKLME